MVSVERRRRVSLLEMVMPWGGIADASCVGAAIASSSGICGRRRVAVSAAPTPPGYVAVKAPI